MKKVLFFAAVCATLVGCAKVELKNASVGGDSPIVFNSPVVGTATTKAVMTGNTYTDAGFDVWALYSSSAIENLSSFGFASQEAAVAAQYLAGVAFTYDSSSDSYTNSGAFWPKQGGNLTFHAISPSGLSPEHRWVAGTSVGVDDFVGFKVSGYTADDGTTVVNTTYYQKDLLFSDIAFGKTKTNDENNDNGGVETGSGEGMYGQYVGVDIKFNHVLSGIKVNAKLAEPNAGGSTVVYKIKKVKIYGLNVQGSVKDIQNETGTVTNYSESWPAWTTSGDFIAKGDEAASTAKVLYTNGEGISVTNTTPVAVVSTPYLVIPQDLYVEGTREVKLYIEYTETIGSTESSAIKAEVSLKNLGGSVAADASTKNAWVPNRMYTYTIVISRDQIKLDPAVGSWTDVAVDATPTS